MRKLGLGNDCSGDAKVDRAALREFWGRATGGYERPQVRNRGAVLYEGHEIRASGSRVSGGINDTSIHSHRSDQERVSGNKILPPNGEVGL